MKRAKFDIGAKLPFYPTEKRFLSDYQLLRVTQMFHTTCAYTETFFVKYVLPVWAFDLKYVNTHQPTPLP